MISETLSVAWFRIICARQLNIVIPFFFIYLVVFSLPGFKQYFSHAALRKCYIHEATSVTLEYFMSPMALCEKLAKKRFERLPSTFSVLHCVSRQTHPVTAAAPEYNTQQ